MMKKKSFLMLIAAAAVVCAVICAAGCVSSEEEDGAAVLGTWYYADDSIEDMFILTDDNRGVFFTVKDEEGLFGLPGDLPQVYPFVWDFNDNKLSFVFEGGDSFTAAFDEKTGSLTSDNLGLRYGPVDLTAGDADIAYIWYYEDDTASDLSIDWADGTGVYYYLEAVVDEDGNPTGELTGTTDTYTWELDAEGHDVTTYRDGTVEHNTYGEKYKTMISDIEGDTLYLLMPDTDTAFTCMLAWAADKLA